MVFSPYRSVRCETNEPPAMRVIPKNSKRDTIKVFKLILKRKEKSIAQKAQSLSHTKWMCKYLICSLTIMSAYFLKLTVCICKTSAFNCSIAIKESLSCSIFLRRTSACSVRALATSSGFFKEIKRLFISLREKPSDFNDRI